MSSKIQGYVWDACAVSGVKGTRLMVMVRLADYSSDEGTSYPGVKTISRQIAPEKALSEQPCRSWKQRDGCGERIVETVTAILQICTISTLRNWKKSHFSKERSFGWNVSKTTGLTLQNLTLRILNSQNLTRQI